MIPPPEFFEFFDDYEGGLFIPLCASALFESYDACIVPFPEFFLAFNLVLLDAIGDIPSLLGTVLIWGSLSTFLPPLGRLTTVVL